MGANFQKKLFILCWNFRKPGVIHTDKETSIFQTFHNLYYSMKLAHNVCFMDQQIFNSKYFESYYKVISRKNIELDFFKYNCKTIVKEKKSIKCTKLNINSKILKTGSQIKYRKMVRFVFTKMPNVTSLRTRTWLHSRDEMKIVLLEFWCFSTLLHWNCQKF